jgi:hypothetical protein
MTTPLLLKKVEDRFSFDEVINSFNLLKSKPKKLLNYGDDLLSELLYEFLKISPSYNWLQNNKLPTQKTIIDEINDSSFGLSEDGTTYTNKGVWDVRHAPEDYESLISNYHFLKDAQKLDYVAWRNQGMVLPLTNKNYKNVEYVWVHLADDHQYADEEAIEIACKNLGNIFYDSIKEDTAYLKIPLNDDKKAVMKKIEDTLDMYSLLGRKNSIKKDTKRINTNALKKGFNLLKNKARYPELDQWRVGLISDVSPTHTKLLSASSQRKVSSIDEKESRDTLGKLTSRALRKYESIAENAARGKFPSEFPKTKIKFDYAEIGKML